MGPLEFMGNASYKTEWVHLFFVADDANKLEWTHYVLWQVLPISLNGPIIFMAGAANKLERAHYVLWQVLS